MPRLPAWTATRRIALAVGAAALVAGFSGAASAQTRLKMVLNWKYQGPQGFFFVAEDKGYFKAEGLDVTIDQGDGSATPIPKVASGTYDVGFGDINALIEFAAKKPDDAPIAVYVMFNQPPFTVAVKADSPIKTPADCSGKTACVAGQPSPLVSVRMLIRPMGASSPLPSTSGIYPRISTT